MKSISFSFYLAVLSLPMVLFGQDLQTKEAVSTQHWYSFPSPLNGDPLLVLYQSWPDLPDGPEESFELLKVRKDALGQEHQLFQWIHAGYPVEWAEIRLHGTAEGWQMVNGFVPKIEFPPSAIKLSEDQARQKAIQEVDAEVYFWENSSNDRLIQSATQGKKTSFFPDAQLMWVDEDHDWQTNAYRLAYRFDIFAQEPMGTYRVYVDAQTGTILKQTDLTHEMEVEGQAHTRHNGVRSIQTDSVAADSFRLREYGRAAAGIETYDLNNSTDLSTAVDFTDSDNVWNNANAQWDEVATDVHWGMEMTYDYFLQEHGWDSYDGNGGKLLSFVHWDVPGSPTAFWNVYFAGFADNNGNPHVGLDVIGHEVMHGVVRNSCDLIYIDEGGALNEGLADIFGNLIQWHTTPDDFSWEVGENSSPFRDMSDPNRFGHPDTYQGTNWYEGDADNGGTHINNNVLGYWFYVLAVGDTSTNDFGNDFELSGIGMETVADIVFRAMSTYWTPTTQFEDARRGTIQAALDLFGTCSPEVNAVRNAWYAVGLGDKVQNMDVGISRILPEEDCKFVADRYITVELTNYGCLPIPGNLINVVVDVPSIGAVVIEPANVDTLAGGESIEMMLATPISMPLVGDYEIRARALLGGDPNASNNAAENEWLFRRETVIGGSTISFQPAFIPFEDLLWWESGESSQVSVLPG
ncbi:MAG: M4 family metallopeptidase, partial [Bacteroidota bacterium]